MLLEYAVNRWLYMYQMPNIDTRLNPSWAYFEVFIAKILNFKKIGPNSKQPRQNPPQKLCMATLLSS